MKRRMNSTVILENDLDDSESEFDKDTGASDDKCHVSRSLGKICSSSWKGCNCWWQSLYYN
jgi:hypothetical protein